MSDAQAVRVPKKLPVSERKTESNRQNALKSTGPKTATGKANSRKNAIKHGLFIKHIEKSSLEEEANGDFSSFYRRLWNELEPVGPREENEVGYIAICWLRLDRLWRYENAEVECGLQRVVDDVEMGIFESESTYRGVMRLLTAAMEETETAGCLSQEHKTRLKRNFYVGMIWERLERTAEQKATAQKGELGRTISRERNIPLVQADLLLARDPKAQPEYARFVTIETLNSLIQSIGKKWAGESFARKQNAYTLESIPDRAMEKVIRYGNAIERQLSRAYARLDQLQTRRKGEPGRAVLDVRLTH